jgi:general secretion pathway protein J
MNVSYSDFCIGARLPRDAVNPSAQTPIRRISHRSGQAGFTLLEVLIASTLMMVMMTLLLGSLRMAAGSWDAGDKQSEQLSRLLVTQNFLRAQLSGLRPFVRPKSALDPSNTPMTLYFHGGPDWVEYATALPPQAHGGVYLLRIFIEGQKNDKRLMISIRPAAGNNDAENSGSQSIEDVVLLEHVQTLRFSYFDKPALGGLGMSPWLSSWTGNTLPWLIKIQIADGAVNWPEMIIAPQVRVKM